LTGLIVGTLTLAIGGCEKQVIRETYRPPGSIGSTHIEYRSPATIHAARDARQPVKKKNFFEEVGDTLFGWIGDDPEPQPARYNNRFDPMWSTPQLQQ
jgi:hypothetical protein